MNRKHGRLWKRLARTKESSLGLLGEGGAGRRPVPGNCRDQARHEGNPAKGHRLYEETPSTRILSVAEIREFWTKLPQTPMSERLRRILQLELLLAQRSGEIAEMRKSEVDLDKAIWVIPAGKNKGARRHEVPLPPLARQIIADAIAEIADQGVPWLCESNRNRGQPFDSKTLGHALPGSQRPKLKGEKSKPAGAQLKPSWVWDFK